MLASRELGGAACEEGVPRGHKDLYSLLGGTSIASLKDRAFWTEVPCGGNTWARGADHRAALLFFLDCLTNFSSYFGSSGSVAGCDNTSEGPTCQIPTLPAGRVARCEDGYRVELNNTGEGGIGWEGREFGNNMSDNNSGIKKCSGGENGKGKGKELSLKRSSNLISGAQGEGGNQGEDDSSTQPNKRPQNNKRDSKASFSQNGQRSFACPYYKNNPIESSSCADWHDTKLAHVKEHCKTHHSKSLLCGRCKKFRAWSFDKITQHLEDDDCEKSKGPNSSEENTVRSFSDFSKAKTWEKIYENLFPLQIPSPFWEDPVEVLAVPIASPQKYTAGSREYRTGLGEFLSNQLGFEQTFIDGLLSEYDKTWMTKSHDRPLLPENPSINDSGVDPDTGPIGQPSGVQEPNQDLTTPSYTYGFDIFMGLDTHGPYYSGAGA